MALCSIYDDRYLFTQIAEGNEEAFSILFEKYRMRLYQVALRTLHLPQMAEEVVQDIFMSLWLIRDRLVEVDDPGCYLYTMTFNKVASALRKLASDGKLRRELKRQFREGHSSTEERVDAKERERRLQEAIDRLPKQRRLIYRLAKEAGWTYDRIATELGLSKHTVRNQMSEALRQVRKYVAAMIG